MYVLIRVCCLSVLFGLCFSEVAHADIPSPRLPDGLSAADWSDIRTQIEASTYRAEEAEKGFETRNLRQGWKVVYGKDGRTSITPSNSGKRSYHIALKLEAIGYGDRLKNLSHPERISNPQASRVEYRWNAVLREWWLNGPHGVEQGFELSERPGGNRSGEALTLAMKLNTDLGASLDAKGLNLGSRDGAVRIGYAKLRAWDTDGKELTARMALAGTRLSLLIDDRDAHYPLTIDPTFSQLAYLKASNTDESDQFGWSVAISGDSLVVGAPFEDSNAAGVNGDESDNSAIDSGAAYVFVRSGTSWSQQAYLKASNTDAGDQFGNSVSISGDSLVVGAPFEDSNAVGVNGDESNNSASSSGAAYVFTRSGGLWSQQAYLKASNTGSDDQFGTSVAISGDSLVVGALLEASNATGMDGNQGDNSALASGAAYVFTRSGGMWSQQTYLKASNTGAIDRFGASVAISGDSVVVGALFEDSNATGVDGNSSDNSATNSGAAYVFVRAGATWSQQAYLKASNTGAFDQFGFSVAISGDSVVVGANSEDSNATGVGGNQADNTATDSGAAYVFVRSGGMWSQQAYLKASSTGSGDLFGISVAISGDRVVVGARLEDSSAAGVDGNQADNTAIASGAAYVFARSGTTWSQQAYLKASNTGTGDLFGNSVASSGDSVVVGAIGEDSNATSVNGDGSDNSALNSGAAYVFKSTLTIGGTVSGLAGSGLVLQNNGGDDLAISADGMFAFATALADGSAYNVTVQTQPGNLSQTCVVGNGSGTLAGANVTNVTVACTTNGFTIGGTVSGLAGSGLVLQNNGGDDLAISADGMFAFATALADGSAYNVTVQTQPTNLSQTCVVGNGSGTLAGANVTNVTVTCTTNTYTIGGTVTGLTGSGLVLQNNNGDDLMIGADGPFTFANALNDGSSYNVTVLNEPSNPNQVCAIGNAAGILAGSNIANVSVICDDLMLDLSTNNLSFDFVASGNSATQSVTLSNAGGSANVSSKPQTSAAPITIAALGDVIIDAIGAPAAPFAISGGSCGATPIVLALGQSCTLEVTFSPVLPGSYQSNFAVTSNAASSPDTVNLSGTTEAAVNAIPTLSRGGLVVLILVFSLAAGLGGMKGRRRA